MKKFLSRSLLPRLFYCIFLLTTFHANVLFSHNFPTAHAENPPPMYAMNVKSHDFHTFASQPCTTITISGKNPSIPSPTRAEKSPNTLPMSATNTQNYIFPSVGSYACILTDNTFFYSSADEKRGVFLLPKTYYVRLLEYRADYCKIEYQTDTANAKRLVGYARTADLTFVNYTPVRPYLYYTFDLRYKIEDAAQVDSTFLTELTLTCTYYGDYIVGSERYCYILRGDEFGYVPKPDSLQYEENCEYADYLASLQPDPAPPDVSSDDNSKSTPPAQIAILVAICLLVPILAALVLKPPRRPPYEIDD